MGVEDLSHGQKAVAIYDYQGGKTLRFEFLLIQEDLAQHELILLNLSSIVTFLCRGRRWDLLQSRRCHRRHRDDRRRLVEGTVSRACRSVPGCVRPAHVERSHLVLHMLHMKVLTARSWRERNFLKETKSAVFSLTDGQFTFKLKICDRMPTM